MRERYLTRKMWFFLLTTAFAVGLFAGEQLGAVGHAAINDEQSLPFMVTNMHKNIGVTEDNHTMGSALSEAALKASISEAGSTAILHYLRMPVGLPSDEVAAWNKVAKAVAAEDRAKTGRTQQIVQVSATPKTITIGGAGIPRVDAVDVASYQGWMTQTDYNQLAKTGVKTIVIKITEGDSYQNPYAKSSLQMARNAGLSVAVYDYALFNSAGSAASEARFAAKTMQQLGLAKDTLVFADMEEASCVAKYLTGYWQVLNGQGYSNHGVYTGGGYSQAATAVATVGQGRTWWAQYPINPQATTLLNTQYGAWQFSSTAVIPKGSTQSRVDVSHDYNGLLTSATLPQGEKIPDNRYVTVTSRSYISYSGFNFKGMHTNAELYHRTYHSTGKYQHMNGSTYLSLYDNDDRWAGYINEQAVTVGAGPQGAWQGDNRYVTVTNRNYVSYSGFNFKGMHTNAELYLQTYHSTGQYYHMNGSTYVSLYDNSGKWVGYINEQAVSVASGPQGVWQNDDRYVTVTSRDYISYSAFTFKGMHQNAELYQRTYHSTGQYHHMNGSTYLSLYDNAGKWAGYINEVAVHVVSGPQGAGFSDDRFVTVTSRSYISYSGFNFKGMHSIVELYHQTYHSTGQYHHMNGSTYLSLYDHDGRWAGYINEQAVTVGAGPQGAWQEDNRYVTVTNRNYVSYSGFNFKGMHTNAELYLQTYHSTGQYYHMNGSTYVSLYDNSGKWVGYINEQAVSVASGPQGVWLQDNRYVTVTSRSYISYSAFTFKGMLSNSQLYHKKYHSTGQYHHMNGGTYVSLYDASGKWAGYINELAVTVNVS